MNKNPPLIAVVCGLITALLFLAPLTLGGLGFVMSTFTAMPLFVAALGFGTVNAIIAGVVAAVAVSFFTGVQGAIIVGGATLLPAIWVGHMVGLFRDDDGTQEWFPISTILFRMALMCAVIAIGFGASVGYSPEWAANQVETVLTQFANLQPETADAPILTPEQIKQRSVEAAGLIPIAMPMSLLLLMVINLLLAARFARKRGWILRPQVNLPLETAMPQIAVGVFAVAIALSFLSGPIALIAQVVTGAMVGAFLLVGLATLHYLTLGTPIRGVFLGITYFALLASRTLAGVVALIGVGETLFQIRARRGDPNSPSKHF
jgi:hypothetical protein